MTRLSAAFVCFVLAFVCVELSSGAPLRRVCYYTNWAQYRNGQGKFKPENVDPSLCTHLNYAFATLNGNKLKAFEWNDESTPWMKGMYEKFQDLKQQNPSLKTMLAVGGWNLASGPFHTMVATDSSRKEFATTSIEFLRKNGFDGLDLDWEYPTMRGGGPDDKHKFTLLCKVLREEFEKEAQRTGKPRLLLSAAVAAGKDKIDAAYEVPEMSQYVDMINLMTYDLHGSWEDHTGENAPLHGMPGETGNDTFLNVEYAANYWAQKGAPKDKINIGMPLYGHSFTLKDRSHTDINEPARAAGQAGRFTNQAGMLAYYEICEMIKSGATKHWVDGAEVPYLVKGDQWVGYDDPESLRKKVDFVKQNGYGGIMVWALTLDDFSGTCGEGKYPLMNAINDELNKDVSIPAQTNAPQTQPPATTALQTNPPQTNQPGTCGGGSAALRKVCYYTNWAQYRNGQGKFKPENVDPSLCTHLNYAFATLNGNKLKAFEWNDESTPWMKGMYEKFQDLKQQNPSLKTLLAVGGWNLASGPFHRMVATESSRKEFATTTVEFLRKNGFDGLDLDWEYPTMRGGAPDDKHKFTLLCKVLREEFEKEAQTTGKPRLLLSAAVAAGKDKIDAAYEVSEMSQYVDMINLMTYDLHGSWEDHTGENAPLHGMPGETGNDTFLNVEYAANYWAQKGAPKDKINIGMPLYAHTYTLKDASHNALNDPVRAAGQAGQFTNQAGILAYYEICQMIKSGATKHWVDGAEVPYLVKGDQWIGYDDPESLRKKVDFVKQNGYGGIMVWALTLDDFTGTCGEGKYPLMHAINDEINKAGPTCSSTNPPQTQPPTTTSAPQTPVPQTSPPQTNPPQTNPPQTNPPQTNAPTTNQPQTNPPQTNPPQTNPPQTNAPQTNPPQTNAPTTNQPVTNSQTSASPHHHHKLELASQFNCQNKASGYYADASDCSKYFLCAANMAFAGQCAKGLVFDTDTEFCEIDTKGKCLSNATPMPLTTGMMPQTTQGQSTAAPATNSPTTSGPTSNIPVTMAASSNPPMTMAPSTNPPMTNPPMTMAPSTNPPMTMAPSTNPPMTMAPSTNPPMTMAPSSNQPITMSPTTAAPTTNAPTTAVPVTTTNIPVTTAAQTTAVPTTQVPTTAAQTTQAPTTAAPTTHAPTTAAPTTQAPTTAIPTTHAPTTAAPTTQAPTTAAPTTHAPTTAAPTTQAPTTAAPTTQAPTTPAPTTQAPTTPAPTTAASGIDLATFCINKGDGIHVDPTDCQHYFECAVGLTFRHRCGVGTAFNPRLHICDFPAHIPNCSLKR